MKHFAILVKSLLVAALPAQQVIETTTLVERLREIANRETLTEAAAAKRSTDAVTWLQTTVDRDLGGLAILRAMAGTFSTAPDEGQRSRAELIAFLERHATLPAAGFEEAVGRIVLFDFVRRADAGKWGECRLSMPLLLRTCRDHRSAFWLLGRRARDARTSEGLDFLQQVVIPQLLADHLLDDAERVQTLRLLYEVEYDGPRPFTDVVGPGLDGREVRTADYRGRVLLVDYWATWCKPCLMALPSVVEAHRLFREQGFAVVGISIDKADHKDRVTRKVEGLGIEFPVVFDGKGDKSEIALANKVLAIPATFLIDRKGRVRFTGLKGDELATRIAELLAEK